MAVFEDLKTVTGTQYNKAIHNRDILDQVVLRRAKERDIRLPTGTPPDVWNYHGAFVFTPQAGINRNVTYLDLASLYPNLMRACNVGPDTIIGTEEDLTQSEYSESDCVWSYIDTRPVKHVEKGENWRQYTDGTYKMIYDPNQNKTRWKDDPQYERCYYVHPDIQEGFLRELVDDLIDLKYQYEGGLYEAIKRVTNSLYGFCSFLNEKNSSRVADWRIGESITLGGRKVIKETAETAIDVMRDELQNEVYISHGDTDGVGLACDTVASRELMLDAAWEAADYLNDEGYAEFMAETFGVESDAHFMEVEVESFAPSVFVPMDKSSDDPTVGAKKRYAQWITIEDGEETDEIDIKGFEAKRSDIAPITRETQKQIFEWILKEDRQAAWKKIAPYLREHYDSIRSGELDVEQVAKRGGISQALDEYGTKNRSPQPIYRGAKFADEYIDGEELSEGSKPMCIYVERTGTSLPSTYDTDTGEDGTVVDAISVEDPSNLPDDVVIDWEKHCEKSLVGPMRIILKTIGKSWDDVKYDHQQSGLESFAV